MKKEYILASIIIMTGLFIGGLALLFNSTKIGEREGQTAIQAHGGSMDTQQYNDVINNTTENYRMAGAVISLIGGVGILLSGYGVYNEIK